MNAEKQYQPDDQQRHGGALYFLPRGLRRTDLAGVRRDLAATAGRLARFAIGARLTGFRRLAATRTRFFALTGFTRFAAFTGFVAFTGFAAFTGLAAFTGFAATTRFAFFTALAAVAA